MAWSTRHEMPGSQKNLAHGARLGIAIPSDLTIDVTVVVRPKGPLPELPASAPHTSRAEYEARHGADPVAVKAVQAFAAHFDLRVSQILQPHCCVMLNGSVKNFERAFGVELRSHHLADGTSHRGRVGTIKLPTELVGIVIAVFGLDDRAVAWTLRRKPASPHPEPAAAAISFQTKGTVSAFYPAELARLYGFPSDVTGHGERIGIVEIGGGYTEEGLTSYFKTAGSKERPKVSVRPVAGGSSNQPALAGVQNADLEVFADIEIASSVAPGAAIFMYFVRDGSEQQIILGLAAAIHDKKVDPSILSLSFVGPEYEIPPDGSGPAASNQYQDTVNNLFASAAHLGITICAASGDHGSAGYPFNNPKRPWDGKAHVGFPASSPFALACGGTHIVRATVGQLKEEVWHSGQNSGSGGGVSRYFPRPRYQAGIVSQKATNPEGNAGRGIPDVSANASPQSGYRVLADGTWYPDDSGNMMPGGGTSAATPLWAALIALLNESLHVRLGFVNPLLYEIGCSSGAFFDVTEGNNGDYRAAPGWDACTGLGSPHGSNLRDCMKAKLAVERPRGRH